MFIQNIVAVILPAMFFSAFLRTVPTLRKLSRGWIIYVIKKTRKNFFVLCLSIGVLKMGFSITKNKKPEKALLKQKLKIPSMRQNDKEPDKSWFFFVTWVKTHVKKTLSHCRELLAYSF